MGNIEKVFVNPEGEIKSLFYETRTGRTVDNPVLIISKSEDISDEVERRLPEGANAYSCSLSRKMQDSKEGFAFAITGFYPCYAASVQYHKID